MIRPTLPALALALAMAAPAAAQAPRTEAATSVQPTDAGTARALDAAIAAPHRSAANKVRDPYRHPKETLTFFGLRSDMTVVEVSPGGGYYTEILAPVLRERGKYYAAAGNPAASERSATAVAGFKAKLAAAPGVLDRAQVTTFGKDTYNLLPAAGSADMVLSFRNVHNWTTAGFGPQAFAAFYAALKPGGVLGIVEHRLPEDRPDALQQTSGYMKPSEVIRLAEAAGFRLLATSEINANPRDTSDYPKGVWTLAPNFAEGDTDRAKYAAIGESDRATFRFVKPR